MPEIPTGDKPDIPTHLYWDTPKVKKCMWDNDIRDRVQLATRIRRPYSTVQRSIKADWSGPVTSIPVLNAMCVAFDKRLSQLVHEPKDMVAGQQ